MTLPPVSYLYFRTFFPALLIITSLSMTQQSSLMNQLDGLQERGDLVEFDKEIAEMDILLFEAHSFR